MPAFNKSQLEIRAIRHSDDEAVHQLIESAFGQPAEADLVSKLRRSDAYIPELDLVALYDKKFVGQCLVTVAKVVSGTKTTPVLSLAPVSVLPKFQNKMIGSLLVKHAIALSQKTKYKAMIVVGGPKYYARFGFEAAAPHGLVLPFPAPKEAFMVLPLRAKGLTGLKGKVKYPAAFADILSKEQK